MRVLYKIAALTLCAVLMTGCAAVFAPETADNLRAKAQESLHSGNASQAITEYEALCALERGNEQNWRALLQAKLQNGESGVDAYQMLYNMGVFTAEDYLAFAQQSLDAGQLVAGRDLLEESVRLNENDAAKALLSRITADATEDTTEVQAALSAMATQLSGADADGLAQAAADAAVQQTLLPKLANGARRYCYIVPEGTLNAKISREGSNYILHLWLLAADGKLAEFAFSPTEIRYAEVENGQTMSGAYNQQLCDGFTGDTIFETGILASGVLTGDFTCLAALGSMQPDDLLELWQNRANAATTEYTGSFDEQGHAKTDQQKDATNNGGVVYAANETGSKISYLYWYEAEPIKADSYVFAAEKMGLTPWPAYAKGVAQA